MKERLLGFLCGQGHSKRTSRLLLSLLVIFFVLADLGCGDASPYIQHRSISSASTRPMPLIVTKNKTFRVPEGHSVTMPCDVRRLGDHVVVWRKGNNVLSAGSVKTVADPRFLLHTSSPSSADATNRLELRDIRPQDAGDYVCQISVEGDEIIELAHTLEVLVPPRVRSQPTDGKIIVKKGSQVTLECEASGNPVPSVVWSREHDLLPEGTVSGQHQHGYTIRKVTRFDAGRYTCTADNGVGSPAVAQILLSVLYEPEIDVEAEKVHSGLGKEAHLTCIVHGEPRPMVRWYKEQTLLSPNDRIRMEGKEGSDRHTLILKGLSSPKDFGNYSCVAENSLGSSKRHIEVHGRPTPAVFRNKKYQGGRNSFRLIWTVDSYTRIEEYRLLYRQIKPYHPDERVYDLGRSDGSGLRVEVSGTDWTNIIIPGSSGAISGISGGQFHHEKQFTLTDLVPDAQYECLVQAKNKYGWSEASRIHNFYTHSSLYGTPEARDLGWKTGESSSALALRKSVLCLLLATFVQHLGSIFRWDRLI